MELQVVAGTTSFRLPILIQDATSPSGAGLTGLAWNSSGLTWSYWRSDSGNTGATAVTLASATRGTYTSGGFVEIDSTKLPGMYEIGIPNAVLATGATWAVMELRGVYNMVSVRISIVFNDAWATALPGAYTAGQAGYILGTNLNATVSSRLAASSYTAPDNTDIVAIKAKTDNLPASPAATTDIPSASTVAGAVWDEDRASHTVPGSFGEAVQLADAGTAQAVGTTSITLRAGAPASNLAGWFVYLDSADAGAGQVGYITAYDGGTKVASINGWSSGTVPLGTVTYTVFKF